MSTVTELNPRLLALTEAGVSVWLDQIRRSMVEGGELARMVAVESLRGVTSNPAIFEKAILGSTDYDDDLRTLARRVEMIEGFAGRQLVRVGQLVCCQPWAPGDHQSLGIEHADLLPCRLRCHTLFAHPGNDQIGEADRG